MIATAANWKAPPPDSGKNWINRSLELQVLLNCNWQCQACDAFSNFHGIGFIRKATMTVLQVERFIEEMRQHNAYLGRIRIIGGEPTLHPKLDEIVELLHASLVPEHVFQVEIVTNGSNMERIAVHAKTTRIRVSDEAEKQGYHMANLRATPAELGYRGNTCNAPWHSGIALNRFGYFPCAAGSGVSRMRDTMQHQRLSLPLSVNWTWPQKPTAVRDTWPDLRDICDHCYRGLKPEHRVVCGTGNLPGQHELNSPSKEAWSHLAPWLHGKQPDWKVYGE